MDGKASEHAHQAIELASDKQAIDIILLDIRKSNTFADFFVLLTVDNSRHMSAIAEDLGKELTAHGARLHHQEGSADSGWILLDQGRRIGNIWE